MQGYQIISRPTIDQLGEGLMWSARRETLYWVDILAPSLNALEIDSGHTRSWAMPEAIGWIAERRERDDFVIGLKSGFAELSLDPWAIVHRGDPEPDVPGNRLNDAKVDAAGRIWAGSKNDHGDASTAALYRLDPDFGWSKQDAGYTITNGPTFSADGRTLYHADTLARIVYAYTLTEQGELRNKTIFVRFEADWGYPDGMATDAENRIWIAHWGGGRVSCFDSAGKLVRAILLPTAQITNCIFAGKRLDRMFVTSAATGLAGDPNAGALFEVDPGTSGLPHGLFAG